MANMKHEVIWHSEGKADIDEPVMFGRPELKYALETILDNADGFAHEFVTFGLSWDEEALEIAINAGSNDCLTLENYHEIITKKDDFYKVKNTIIRTVKNLIYSGIEWRPNNFIDISKEESTDFENMLEQLHEDDDIQKVFHNCKPA